MTMACNSPTPQIDSAHVEEWVTARGLVKIPTATCRYCQGEIRYVQDSWHHDQRFRLGLTTSGPGSTGMGSGAGG